MMMMMVMIIKKRRSLAKKKKFKEQSRVSRGKCAFTDRFIIPTTPKFHYSKSNSIYPLITSRASLEYRRTRLQPHPT